ncbi:hypothetical protein Vretimale_14089 [Volvox reticuliferus]|uniref:Uncharacterized protein n=1 Tax=Volvox reticuliferus TaxID=1737510 RepID=A0A8J4FSA5_9CHLO|nr:hypothetical protein Vretifemale_16263 [Volvox reticuliferus]GIM10319.1 hypothetical protein Vretimale_14089 [Volvox reticuliferus]
MARKVENDGAGLVKPSFWSPLVQDQLSLSITRSSIGASTGSRALRTGDWRRVAAADTDGEPVQVPQCDRYQDNTPNIDDVHSPASVNFDSGAEPLMASPLVPRALAAGAGLSGYFNVDQELDSPSSGFSLSGGEASLWLDSPAADQLQDPTPSEVSPVQIRRPPPVDSELSTPGSDGYASPSVLFAIRPASLMRSSVQNPLYVERPASSEDDNNVAKALLLSSCAGRSPSSRLPRCTFESGWSSSSFSAEKSISLNPSHHNDKTSPLSHMEVTSSPPASSARQLLPLLAQGEMETPRRIIKTLSAATQDSGPGVDLTTDRTISPSRQRTDVSRPEAGSEQELGNRPQCTVVTGETGAASTPCSAALSACLDPVDKLMPDPAGSKVVVQQRARAELSKITFSPNLAACDLDDTILAGKNLDQTPRKDNKTDNRHIGAGRIVPKETAGKQQRLGKLPRQEVTPRQGAMSRKMQHDSPSMLRTLECCVLLPLIVVLVVLGIRSSSEWRAPATRTGAAKRFDLGPVCFLERYPGENSMRLAPSSTQSPSLLIVKPSRPSNSTTVNRLQIPFCWRQLPNCHALDGLLPFLKVIAVPGAHEANIFGKPKFETIAHVDTLELEADSWAPVENLENFPDDAVGFPDGSSTHAVQPQSQDEVSTPLDASTFCDPNMSADIVQQAEFGSGSACSDVIALPVQDEGCLGANVKPGLTDSVFLPPPKNTELLASSAEVVLGPNSSRTVGVTDSLLASVPEAGVSALDGLLTAPSNASDDATIPQQPFMSALVTKRLYGWTLLDLVLATAAACLAGVLLARVIEHVNPSTQRPQRVARCDNSEDHGNRPSPQPLSNGRILRPKRRPGGSAARQVAQGVRPSHPTHNGPKGQKGSFVWKDDMLIYIGD